MKIIQGPRQSGKSQFVIDWIQNEIKKDNTNIYLIAPNEVVGKIIFRRLVDQIKHYYYKPSYDDTNSGVDRSSRPDINYFDAQSFHLSNGNFIKLATDDYAKLHAASLLKNPSTRKTIFVYDEIVGYKSQAKLIETSKVLDWQIITLTSPEELASLVKELTFKKVSFNVEYLTKKQASKLEKFTRQDVLDFIDFSFDVNDSDESEKILREYEDYLYNQDT